MKRCNVCLASKAVFHKPYGNLQSLPVPTHRWKNLLMDFVIGLPILTDWKGDIYDSILVIVNQLTKMIHYKPVKVTIDAPGLAEVIIDMLVRHHGLLDSIVTDRGSLFASKFWSSLYYFLGIKQRISTAFYPQTDGQIKRQNSTMEAYLRTLSTSSRMIEPGSYCWLSLPTITPKILAPASCFLSSTTDIILGFLTKKTSIPAQNREPQKNYPLSSES